MTNFIWKYKKHDVLESDKISKDFSCRPTRREGWEVGVGGSGSSKGLYETEENRMKALQHCGNCVNSLSTVILHFYLQSFSSDWLIDLQFPFWEASGHFWKMCL